MGGVLRVEIGYCLELISRCGVSIKISELHHHLHFEHTLICLYSPSTA
jgi:hypothetical protein